MQRRKVLASIGTASFLGLAGCGSGRSSSPVETHTKSGDWQSIFHDTQNTNSNPEAKPPTATPAVETLLSNQFDSDEGGFGPDSAPTPVILEDRVLFGGDKLSCHDLETGKEQWAAESNKAFLGLTARDGMVIATQSSSDHKWSLSAYNISNGKQAWNQEEEWKFLSQPIATNNQIFVGAASELLSLSRDGEVRWRRSVIGREVLPPVAISESGIFTRASKRNQKPSKIGLGKLSRNQGILQTVLGDSPNYRWVTHLPLWMYAPPVYSNEVVIIATTNAAKQAEGNAYLFALNQDGEVLWHIEGGSMWSTPAIADGTVFVMNYNVTDTVSLPENVVRYQRDVNFQAIDLTSGSKLWEQTFANLGSLRFAPVVANNTVYLSLYNADTEDSLIVALSTQNGKELWRHEAPSPAYHLATAGDRLYASLWDGSVLSFI